MVIWQWMAAPSTSSSLCGNNNKITMYIDWLIANHPPPPPLCLCLDWRGFRCWSAIFKHLDVIQSVRWMDEEDWFSAVAYFGIQRENSSLRLLAFTFVFQIDFIYLKDMAMMVYVCWTLMAYCVWIRERFSPENQIIYYYLGASVLSCCRYCFCWRFVPGHRLVPPNHPLYRTWSSDGAS